MGRRKKQTTPRWPAGWLVTYEATSLGGRHLRPGTEVSLRGRPGRWRFVKAVQAGDKDWLDFIGGAAGRTHWVSVRREEIRRVHRIDRTRQNTAPTPTRRRSPTAASAATN